MLVLARALSAFPGNKEKKETKKTLNQVTWRRRRMISRAIQLHSLWYQEETVNLNQVYTLQIFSALVHQTAVRITATETKRRSNHMKKKLNNQQSYPASLIIIPRWNCKPKSSVHCKYLQLIVVYATVRLSDNTDGITHKLWVIFSLQTCMTAVQCEGFVEKTQHFQEVLFFLKLSLFYLINWLPCLLFWS